MFTFPGKATYIFNTHSMQPNRRTFMKNLGQFAAGYSLLSFPLLTACDSNTGKGRSTTDTTATAAMDTTATTAMAKPLFFKISLAEWSLHKSIHEGKMTNLDFPVKARNEFGIEAVEFVDQLFKDKTYDQAYLNELKKRCDDNGVKSVLIMVDTAGHLADTNDKKRKQAVENHYKWVDAAKFLGCHSIRVNAAGEGSAEAVAKAAVDGLGRLSEYGAKNGINVIVENHGGYSSDGKWLSNVMKQVNMPQCGTLPDFGNFCVKNVNDKCEYEYDRYTGVQELMPFAKGVSAKSHEFDANGNETHTDYPKMLQIVKNAGYNGYIGIEYEGSKLSEEEGIRMTKQLLERVGGTMA
jgi:sugar phosphate isomerase/epimerase